MLSPQLSQGTKVPGCGIAQLHSYMPSSGLTPRDAFPRLLS